jgi:hypothetical protein
MATCTACGERLDPNQPVFRTRQPKCYVFHGAPDDFRNGFKFHTRDGVVLDGSEVSIQIPAHGEPQWAPPRQR